MKFPVIFLIAILCCANCPAQTAKQTHNPVAVALNTTAQKMYQVSKGNHDTLLLIGRLLDSAAKLDNTYYEGWLNKLTFECTQEHYEAGLKTTTRMEKLFPAKTDPILYHGVLEYKTGRKKEATATFNKLLKMFATSKRKDYNSVIMWKGIMLILVDKPREGKTILQKLYDAEPDPYSKSYIGYYINSDKETIINDKIPGR